MNTHVYPPPSEAASIKAPLFAGLALLLCFLLPVPHATASQVQGHLYFASRMLAENPEAATIVNGDGAERLYKLGALAPDSAWLTRVFTDPQLQKHLFKDFKVPDYGLSGPVNCSHNEQALTLATNMLGCSRNRMQSAYALGWISHWITDSYMHELINEWGGYFFESDSEGLFRHKILEALETKQLLKMGMPTGHWYLAPDGVTSSTVGDLLVSAFAATFPDNPDFKGAQSKKFIQALLYGEDLVFNGSYLYYREYSAKTSEQLDYIKDSVLGEATIANPAGNPISMENRKSLVKSLVDLPPDDMYDQITQPMAATVTPSPTSLVVTVHLKDSKLYGRFLLEWLETAKEPARASKAILPLCVSYLNEHQAAVANKDARLAAKAAGTLREIAAALRSINPNEQMDMPTKTFEEKYQFNWNYNSVARQTALTSSNAKNAWGTMDISGLMNAGTQVKGIGVNVINLYNVTNLYCDYEIKTKAGATLAKALQVNLAVQPPDGVDSAAASHAREQVLLFPVKGVLSIPLNASAEYDYAVTVYCVTNRMKEGTDFVTVKSGGDSRQGDVMLSDIFDVDVPVPAGVPADAQRRWVTLEEYRRLDYSTLPDLRDAPTNSYAKMIADQCSRWDVVELEGAVQGNRLKAKLQISGLNWHSHEGAQRLLVAFIPKDIPDTTEKAIYKRGDMEMAIMKANTPQQAELWLAHTQPFTAAIKKQPLTEEEQLDLIGERSLEAWKLAGHKTGNLDPAAWSSFTRIRIVPAALEIKWPAEWGPTNSMILNGCDEWYTKDGKPACLVRHLGKQITIPGKEGRFGIWLYALFSVSFGNAPDIQKTFASECAPGDQVSDIEVAGFKGKIFQRAGESTETARLNGELKGIQKEHSLKSSFTAKALLVKGATYMRISYQLTGVANNYAQFVGHTYDDRGFFLSSTRKDAVDDRIKLKELMESSRQEIAGIMASIKLVPDKTFVPSNHPPVDLTGVASAAPVSKQGTSTPGDESATATAPGAPGAPSVTPAGKQTPPPPSATAPTPAAPVAPATPAAPAAPAATAPGTAPSELFMPSPAPVGVKSDTASLSSPNSPGQPPAGPGPAVEPSKPSPDQGPKLNLVTTTVQAGKPIVIKLVNPPREKFAWIGFYRRDAGNKDYIKYAYLNTLDNNTYEDVLAPDEPGEYNFRLFKDESYQPVMVSPAIKVQ